MLQLVVDTEETLLWLEQEYLTHLTGKGFIVCVEIIQTDLSSHYDVLTLCAILTFLLRIGLSSGL